MYGYIGVILRVNLSTSTVYKEPLRSELARDYVGGRGINSRLLYEEMRCGCDPLGDENKIIIGVGPCGGTIVPGSQRFTITSKSPLTGILGDSNSGGSFGVELKYAGYDLVIIEGKARHPVYLWIDNDRVELRSAASLWGKTPRDTSRAIQKEIGDPDVSTLTIGTAGENLVRFACVIADMGRAIGRTGQGAIFGSKYLKAIAVRGNGGVRVAHVDRLENAASEVYEGWRSNGSEFYEKLARYGQAWEWMRYEESGLLVKRNFRGGVGWKSLLEGLDEKYLINRPKACFSCPVGCDHLCVITKGPYAGTYQDAVETGNLLDFGPKIGCDDMDLAYKASELCDLYGVDNFDMTSIIAYAMECFEKGILGVGDTGGIKLEWGDADAILNLIHMTSQRQGIGDILSQGLGKAAKSIGKGSERFAMQAKGQGIVAHDIRGSKGWGLGFAVSSRGPCHVRAHIPEGAPASVWDISVKDIIAKYDDPLNPLLEEGKAELVKWHEDLVAFQNSLGICLFTVMPWILQVPSMPRILRHFYESVTGMGLAEDELLRVGERIVNTERAFNVREGLTRRDDTLPPRVLEEPMPDGPAKGQVVKLDLMIDEYYEHRRWYRDSGFPTKRKLLELGLGEIAQELEELGKLGD